MSVSSILNFGLGSWHLCSQNHTVIIFWTLPYIVGLLKCCTLDVYSYYIVWACETTSCSYNYHCQ